DVCLPEPGRGLLGTGSNLLGKRTLLRAMRNNAVLAFAAAPVCAADLALTPLASRTRILISDPISSRSSHAYAHVVRLTDVVDAASSGGLPVLCLLDEILHGTNSQERQIGARWVMAELMRRGAIGAVSTHDAGLCELPEELMTRVVQCHFREVVREGRMSFDY